MPMEYSDFLKSGLGAVIGFALAQFVNLVKVARDWLMRPRLRIEPVSGGSNGWRILMHSAQVNRGEFLEEETYGFYVHNIGRTIATGVRFQLIKIEYRGSEWPEFAEASNQTSDLAVYNGSGANKRGAESATLVPGAKTLVHLGSWREDYDVVFPAIHSIPDYYEESCSSADEFRFTVVAYDDHAHFTTGVAIIRAG
jgi:hypothetical protein